VATNARFAVGHQWQSRHCKREASSSIVGRESDGRSRESGASLVVSHVVKGHASPSAHSSWRSCVGEGWASDTVFPETVSEKTFSSVALEGSVTIQLDWSVSPRLNSGLLP
jgi:hypothetical protein